MLGIVFIAMLQDLAKGKVSNFIIIAGMLLGLVLNYFLSGIEGIMNSSIGIVLPILSLFIVFIIKGIGAGDIKLFSVIGAFIGGIPIIKCIVTSLIIGAIIGIAKIILNHQISESLCGIKKFIVKSVYFRSVDSCVWNKNNTIHFTIPIFISVLVYTWEVL